MIKIYVDNKSNAIFLDYFRYCLRYLKYKYEVFSYDEDSIYNKSNILIVYNSKKIIIDFGDNSNEFSQIDYDNCDKYIKCQYLISKYEENKDIDKKLEVIPLFRSILNTKCGYNLKFNPFEYFKKYQNNEKKYKIVSYTNGHHTPGRLRIYNILEEHFPDDFKLIACGKRDKGSRFRNDESLSYEEYIKFISSGYFMLNLIGKQYSNPLRCVDGILADTCVVSDTILTKAFSDFPRYDLGISTQDDKFDEKILIEKVSYLIENYEEIYDELCFEQMDWVANHFDEKVYVNKILN